MRLPRVAIAAVVSLISVLAFATDPPSSQVNPQSGYIEIGDVTPVSGVQNARHIINPGPGKPLQVTVFPNASHNDSGTRLAIAPSGGTWLTWWRDASPAQVVVRDRNYSTGAWTAERVASRSDEESRYPSITHDGSHPWLCYQVLDGGTNRVAVVQVVATPDPLPSRTIAGSTTFGGLIDPQVLAESGHLWISWIDSALNVGWARYDYTAGTWSLPAYESYSADSVAAARDRIRTTVLSN